MNPEEVRAGALVGAGALLAGPLYKRSAWKREWNRRFVVLTTETLTWYKSEAGDVGEECRAVLAHSLLDSSVCVGTGTSHPLITSRGYMILQKSQNRAAGTLN